MWTLLSLLAIAFGIIALWFWPSRDKESDPFITVFSTGDPGQIAFIKSLLEDSQIPYSLQGEGVQDLFGLGRLGAGYNMITGPVRIQVPESRAQEARELLNDMEKELGHS